MKSRESLERRERGESVEDERRAEKAGKGKRKRRYCGGGVKSRERLERREKGECGGGMMSRESLEK